MPHGTPDWGLEGPKETVFGLDDLGEHAGRLGSPHLWDRRGDVVHITDFSEGLGIWTATFWAAPAYVTLFTSGARSGAYCVKLVTGGVAVQGTGLIAHIPMPRVTRIGLEYTFSTRSTQTYWSWYLTWNIGTDQYHATVRWDLVNSRLEYLGADGLRHLLADNVAWEDLAFLLNTGKMVIDSQRWEYSRFLLNDQTYPMAGLGVHHTTPAAANHFRAGLELFAPVAIEAEGYVDSLIVTQNEP